MAKRRRGFTLVEVIVSVALLAVGIVAVLSTIGHMTKTEAMVQEGERMRRLADEKLQELIGTGDYVTLTDGDFSERGENRYTWTSALEPTGVESLESLTVTVVRVNRRDDLGYDASQLIYIPPVATGGATP